jgi:hypothetical protein
VIRGTEFRQSSVGGFLVGPANVRAVADTVLTNNLGNHLVESEQPLTARGLRVRSGPGRPVASGQRCDNFTTTNVRSRTIFSVVKSDEEPLGLGSWVAGVRSPGPRTASGSQLGMDFLNVNNWSSAVANRRLLSQQPSTVGHLAIPTASRGRTSALCLAAHLLPYFARQETTDI